MYKINDPLFPYLDSSVPLEDYSRELTKHELLRLNYKPTRLTKGCSSSKNVNKLLDLLLKKNKNEIKSLNLSNCMVDLEAVKKLKLFPNLKGLVLENSFNWIPSESLSRKNWDDSWDRIIIKTIKEISTLKKLELLDLSNNYEVDEQLIHLNNMKSLKILSLQSRELRYELPLDFSNFTNLIELDLYGNVLKGNQLRQISKLSKLTYLDVRRCCEYPLDVQGARHRLECVFALLECLVKLKNLEVLKVSLPPQPQPQSPPQPGPSARARFEHFVKRNLPKLQKIDIKQEVIEYDD